MFIIEKQGTEENLVTSLYQSTRDDQLHVSSKQAIVTGFAADQGLFVLPDLGANPFPLEQLAGMDYQTIAQAVLERLLPDFSQAEIKAAIAAAYDHSFSDPKITPLQAVGDFQVLELFHGPTAAFKDVGLQLLPQLMQRAVATNEQVMVLAATSGDTGTAALNGFRNQARMGVSVFYPDGGVSPVQQRQMLTTTGKNTRVAAIEGNFDDAQRNVKRIFNDAKVHEQLTAGTRLSSANSINIGRLIPQVVYYFSAYQQLLEQGKIKLGDQINFTVPTGNFGDVLAGFYAKQLGLPIKKLVIACNQNNVLADFWQTGTYDRNRPFYQTLAPSMDIQVSSNLERLLYYESDGDTQLVGQLMNDLDHQGKYQVPATLLEKLRHDFASGFTTDAEIEATIRQVFVDDHYLMDPHTATGYHVMRQYQQSDPDTPMVLLSTASPYKFVDAVADAVLGQHAADAQATTQQIADYTNVPVPPALQKLWDLTPVQAPQLQPAEMTAWVVRETNEVFKHD
ncbi:threonine synthase [Fructilactobacillus carniphilus]|uniref:Threonine synthase n=1 Tax=Fructilactobacillus carniphilus TaxID=2940297 RepID=A0ABY5BZK0_9LACO|nr:threonine synthase [Fructilactobacillus carniphilus]USS90798.1 threonine synthase [Fructilactobacillus carniphilus]